MIRKGCISEQIETVLSILLIIPVKDVVVREDYLSGFIHFSAENLVRHSRAGLFKQDILVMSAEVQG